MLLHNKTGDAIMSRTIKIQINPLRGADFSAHLSQAMEEFLQNN